MTMCVNGYQCNCKPDDGVPCPYFVTGYGRWWWRREWYSICSAHQSYDPNCATCQYGSWQNLWLLKCSYFFFWLCPPLWRWWANR